MLEKLAKSIEEVNVLAEHYRTCQNVAAIESLAKECFISKEDTDAFIAGKRKFLLKVLLTQQAVSVTEKTDRRNASFAGFWVCDRAWHVSFRPCQKRSGYERCDPPAT